MPQRFDFLVLGGGVAGLSFALEASRHGTVAVLTKRSRAESNTGMPRAASPPCSPSGDSFELHLDDTLNAGAGLYHTDAVEVTVREGPERVRELAALGAHFDTRPDGEFDLTREGGHSARRIVHSGDITGREVERALLAAADDQPSIHFFPDAAAIDLILERNESPRPAPLPRGLRAPGQRADRDLPRQGDGAGHRRRGEGLPLHDQPRRGDRRRGGDGLPGGRAHRQHGVLPVPPHLPLQPRGEELPHLRGAARRGRQAPAAQRTRSSWSATTRGRSWPRATSWPAPSTPS